MSTYFLTSPKTVKGWISVLECMHVIALVSPFSSNLSKRLIKTPKVYFIDTGLACRLQGWSSSEPILTSPQQGHLFENLVFSEIFKINQNFGLGWEIFHWRSREGEEIDFLLKLNPNKFQFIEAKVSALKVRKIETFIEVRKVFSDNPPAFILCHQEGEQVLGQKVPVAKLKEFLLNLSYTDHR